MSSDPWMFDEIEGPARVQRELAEQGWTLFHAPELLHRAEDPLGLSALLFGGLPLRYRSQELQADPVDPQRADYWRSKREAKLHTDGPACGLPPSAVVMMCRQPASDGGDVILLDTWPLLRAIEAEDPALFGQLFDVPHRFHFGDSDHWGPTFALRRGHLVVFHIGIADKSSETSRRFHARVDEAEKIHFRLRKRDVYIVNNHRCLHGRLAFEDLGRSIHRLMLWLLPPFAAPVDLVARASKGSDALAERLADQPPWVRRRFGVEGAAIDPATLARLALAVDLLIHPRDTATLPREAARDLSDLQDTLLSACAAAIAEPRPAFAEGEVEVETEVLRVLAQVLRAMTPEA